MASKSDIQELYTLILAPLANIYSKFLIANRGPNQSREPKTTSWRPLNKIPLIFGSIMGGQPGIFLGD